MDPNQTWQDYLAIVREILRCSGAEKEELLVEASLMRINLITWLNAGGFEPDWTENERLLFLV